MKETIERLIKQIWFFEKINKIDQSLTRLIKKKKGEESNQQNQDEKGEVTTDNTEIQRIIRDDYEHLNANKMDDLEEMDRFLAKVNLTRLNQEEREMMNKPIIST